jgi:ligand-binding sensor domain-containing protein
MSMVSSFRIVRLLIILAILPIVQATAQLRDIKFHHITVDMGLPSNTVNAVITDSRGFIWIASENGVGRYDGYSFTNFRSKEKDSLTISSNITYVVIEDHQERLWVASERGLDLYNRKLDRFDKHFFNGIPVRAIYQDKKGRLWVGSDTGLYLYNEHRGVFIRMFDSMFDTGEVVYNTIPSITEDRLGKIWVGTSNGVYVIDKSVRSFKRFSHHKNQPGSLSENSVRKIVEDPKGRIWIATYGGGLNLFQPESGDFHVYQQDINNPHGLSTNLIPTLWANDDGKLWIGTDGKGIDILDPETGIFHHVVHSPYNSKSLNNNVVRSISTDHRGGVWVGTYNGGVNFFNQNAEAFFHYKVPTINGNSSVTAFAEEKNGNLWVGTDGGGLSYFNRATGQFVNLFHDERNKNSLSDNRIISLQIDENGELWIGTYLGGISRYNPRTKTFTRYDDTNGSGLTDNVIWTMLIDSQKRIWAGTNKGLNLFDRTTNKFTHLDITNSNLSNNMIRCLFEDKQQRLWIGTQEGLNLLEKPYKKFTVIKSDQQKENSLSNHWVRTINSDHQGNLWIGTFSGGLNLFDEMSNSFLSFTESDGLPDNIVSGILGDHNNNLWISTQRGLAFLDMKNRTFRNYNVSDGLQDYQYNINACFETQQGEFLFGGNNGFTLFVPDVINEVKNNQYPPRVALTSFKIFNKEVIPDDNGSALRAQINETKKITIPYDQNVLTFEFSALNFIQPEKNEFAYMLSGFEDNWNMVGNQRSATYTNIEPGLYTFKVKASNNDNIWNDTGTSVVIEILPPFWETWWFKAIIAFVAMASALLILDFVRNRIREKIRINKIIAELELKALIAQMNPHFIFNCLTSIQELIIMHKQDEAMHYLNQFSRLLRTVLQSSEKNFIPLDEELTLIELYLELESMRFDKQFHYKVSVDSAIDPEDIIIPSFLLQPFIENALWHGLMHKKGDRNLNVNFTLERQDVLQCKISDNGIGREQAARMKKNSIKSYQSMGTKIIRERMELMKQQSDVFDLQIIDETDQKGNPSGTTVVIKIPLGINEPKSDKSKMLQSEQVDILIRKAEIGADN